MAIYTLSMNYIEGVGGNQSHLYNVFLRFSNPECEHKAAIDKSKKLLKKYSEAAKENSDLFTWLGWMCNTNEFQFETIDITIPDGIDEEEMYLMVAAKTKPYKKVIVGSHQCWKNFEYQNNCNVIHYANEDILVLDKNEALNEIKATSIQHLEINNNMNSKNNPWLSGSFYLIAFLFILFGVALAAIYLPLIALPLILIVAVISLSVIGALQLKNDKRLIDKSFIELMGLSLIKLSFLRAGRDKKDENT